MESPASDMTRVSSPTDMLASKSSHDGDLEKASSPHNPAIEKAASEDSHDTQQPAKTKKDLAFWMIMLSIACTCFLSALDLTSLSNALPAISRDLPGQYSYVGSAYALSSTVFLPVTGAAAQQFGRKPVMMSAIVIFAIGSAMCGAAPSLWVMIFGRTVAGVGGGAILATSEIIVADLVALNERGLFMGLLGLVWAISSAAGPMVGGAISEKYWRALFYMNLPIAGIALALVWTFMKLRVPAGSLKEKLLRIDWVGSAIFVASSTLIVLGLTFGDETFPWASAGTLVPLILGFGLLPAFYLYERKFAKNAILPFELFNRTTLLGYITTCIHGIIVMALVYFLPLWFQAVAGRTPILSGVSMLPVSLLVAPFAILAGVSVTVTQNYTVVNWIGWVLTTAGAGVMALASPSWSHQAASALQIPISVGLGLLYAATTFPVLSPVPPSLNAHAMSFHAFSRSFGQVLGITIAAATFNNRLSSTLPAEFASSLPHGSSSAYSAIAQIPLLPESLRLAVKTAFSDSIATIWYVLIGFAGLGLLCSLFIKSLPLAAVTDEQWGIERKQDPAAAVPV